VEAVSRPIGTRRRGAALEEVILDAAWEELNEVGYEQMTIAGVATRARTGKQVLYRRWPNRVQLAVAAVNHRLGPPSAEPVDTGSLRGDLLALLEATSGRVSGVDPGILRGILSEFLDEDHAFGTTMPTLVATLVDRAVARGELPDVRVPDRVLSLPGDLARNEVARVLRSGGPGNLMERLHRPLTEIVDQVFLPLVRALPRET
jgi:AcrR family transcriptional regulator